MVIGEKAKPSVAIFDKPGHWQFRFSAERFLRPAEFDSLRKMFEFTRDQFVRDWCEAFDPIHLGC